MKQTIEIEVPEGKQAIIENNQIKYIDSEHWKAIKTVADARKFCLVNDGFTNLIASYNSALLDTYEDKVIQLRLVIAALTNNKKLSFTSGTIYYPALQLYKADHSELIIGKNMIGTIITEGERYVVVSITAHTTCLKGLGDFPPDCPFSSVSTGINIGLPSKEIADHLTKYFGKLIFKVMYGGSNYDWVWIEKDKK